MVKAIKLLNDRHEEQITEQGDEENDNSRENEDDSEADDEDGQGEEVLELADLQETVPYRRLMCMAHSLQLVIKKAYVVLRTL